MAVSSRTANSIVQNLYNQAGFQDPAGKAWWTNQIASGAMSPEQATRAFQAALPAPAAAPAPTAAPSRTETIAPVVSSIRDPAPAAAAADPRASTKVSAADQVRSLFLRDLNREPDAAGKAFWEQRAKEVSPAQLNKEFREAAKAENPQAGSLPTPYGRSTLPGEPGYQETSKSFLEAAAPFIIPAIAIVAPTFLPSIGSALGATTTVGANALGSAVVNAGMAAVQGESGAGILRAAAAGGAGGAASTLAGQAVAGAQAAGTLPAATTTAGRVLGQAAQGAAGGAASTLVRTGDVGKALEAGGIGGLASGAGELASVTGQQLLPAGTGRTTQALVAGGLGGATEAAVQRQDPLLGGITSAALTTGREIQRENQTKQAANVMQQIIDTAATDPAVNIQLAQALPVTAEQVQQLSRMGESKAAESILRQAANDPKFIRTAANEASLEVLRNAGYNTLANALSQVAVGMTTLLTPGNVFQETNEDAIMAEKLKQFVTPIASTDFALAPVEVVANKNFGKLAPNESIGNAGELLENGKPTGLFVDRAGTLYDEAGNPSIKNYAPPSAIPPSVTRVGAPISPQLPIQPISPRPEPGAAPVTPPSISPEITPTTAPGITPAPATAPAPATTPTPEAVPSPEPGRRVSPVPEPAPEPVPRPLPEPVPSPVAPPTAPISPLPPIIPERDKAILDLTGLTPTRPTPEQVPTPDLEPINRLPEVEAAIPPDEEEPTRVKPEEDFRASQTFPLTPPTTDPRKELINYIYGNINQSPFLLQPGQIQPGTSALAQALGVGDPGASYLGKKGKERRPVWNIESLKLKDELGGDYG